MTDTNPRPWHERVTCDQHGDWRVDGEYPSNYEALRAAKRGVLDEAHDLAAERDELRIQLHGCACPAPYDTCPHDEPMIHRLERAEAEVERLRTLLATPADGPLRVERDTYSNAECPHRLYMGENFLCALFPAEADAIEAQLAARPAHDLPDGVQPWTRDPIEIDGIPVVGVAMSDVVQGLSDDEWLRARYTSEWYDSPNAGAPDGLAYLLGRKPTPEPQTERVQIEGPYSTNGGQWRISIDLPSKAIADELVARMVLGADGTVEVLR